MFPENVVIKLRSAEFLLKILETFTNPILTDKFAPTSLKISGPDVGKIDAEMTMKFVKSSFMQRMQSVEIYCESLSQCMYQFYTSMRCLNFKKLIFDTDSKTQCNLCPLDLTTIYYWAIGSLEIRLKDGYFVNFQSLTTLLKVWLVVSDHGFGRVKSIFFGFGFQDEKEANALMEQFQNHCADLVNAGNRIDLKKGEHWIRLRSWNQHGLTRKFTLQFYFKKINSKK